MSLGSGEKHISTDVLVIGGGMAGMFAAIKAREQGVDVTLTDKGTVGKSGATHFAEGDIQFFRPARGHKLDAWLEEISRRCEYLNNREWDEIVLKESENTFNDLVSWGIKFYEENGELYVNKFSIFEKGSTYESISMINREYAPILRKKALESGVRILDKIMFCDLLKQDGEIVGAVGFDTTSGDLYIFKARAIVIATGSSSFKTDNLPVHYWTGDGQAMAYRAGAELAGEEFSLLVKVLLWLTGSRMPKKADIKQKKPTSKGTGISGKIIDVMARFPSFDGGPRGWLAPSLNAEGNPIIGNAAWEVHCGRAPLYVDLDSYHPELIEWLRYFFFRVGTALPDKMGLDVFNGGKVQFPAGRTWTTSMFAGSGIWPVNKSCATALPGLYAAGNSCATMVSGASYAGMGCGLNHAAVTGTRAGLAAAEYASKPQKITLDEAELTRLKKIVYAPMERRGGFSPGWVTQILQNLVTPYYIFQVKHGERLQAALTFAEFINNHLVPKLMAKDAHEWRMAHEVKNMALTAEMRLRASLFRTESRGGHFREDYPRRDDPTWLAWVKLKDEQGTMKLLKEPVPKEWWPDLSKPYEERYPTMFPGE